MAGEPYSNKVDSSLDRIPFDIVKLGKTTKIILIPCGVNELTGGILKQRGLGAKPQGIF